MARTTIKLPYNGDYDNTNNNITSVLIQNNFKEYNYNGESVWKKGVGLLTAMQYIKIEFSNDSVTLSAWVQAGLGNMGGGEMALNGIVAAAPKKSLMKVIEQIKSNIR